MAHALFDFHEFPQLWQVVLVGLHGLVELSVAVHELKGVIT